MDSNNLKEIGREMLRAEDEVKRFIIKGGSKKAINYKLLWQEFRDCALDGELLRIEDMGVKNG